MKSLLNHSNNMLYPIADWKIPQAFQGVKVFEWACFAYGSEEAREVGGHFCVIIRKTAGSVVLGAVGGSGGVRDPLRSMVSKVRLTISSWSTIIDKKEEDLPKDSSSKALQPSNRRPMDNAGLCCRCRLRWSGRDSVLRHPHTSY